MNYKTLKTISSVVMCLLFVSIILTVLGIKKHNELVQENATLNNKTENKDENITFRYFLEDVEVQEIPQNEKIINKKTKLEEVNILYKFDGIKCSEGVKAEFNEDEWKINILKNGSGTCDVTFYKSNYDMSFIVINGVEDENNPKTVERYKDGEFIIKPNDGFEYAESQCSNDKIASYDKTKNILKLSAVNSDIACKVTFKQKKLQVELTVKNGVLTDGTNSVSKMEAYYGESVTQIVTPMAGYEYTKGHLVCEPFDPSKVNKSKKKSSKTTKKETELVQKEDFKSNNFTIDKVLIDTKCTLTFTKTKVVKYKIKITNSEEYSDIFTISKGNDEIDVESGSTGEIKIKALTEETPKLKCNVLPKDANPNPLNSEYTFTWLNVTKNISCTLSK